MTKCAHCAPASTIWFVAILICKDREGCRVGRDYTVRGKTLQAYVYHLSADALPIKYSITNCCASFTR